MARWKKDSRQNKNLIVLKNMCLTIPKKVIAVKENTAVVEGMNGDRQEVKTIVNLNVGDFCLTQQNVAIEKFTAEEARELISLFKTEKRKVKS
jgi:hydrogenase maturation factor